ncbi:hypothetical protein ACFPMF_24880 [Larkinella bovis]|uniref:DUF5683 domain-containing protein n=1 Tax=Larkinella bovis TaxID=683041 RepID=A0ABW0III6_9BACT
MKILLPLLFLGLSVHGFGQALLQNRSDQNRTTSLSPVANPLRTEWAAMNLPRERSKASPAYADDSLWSKRGFITTSIYHRDGKLSNATIREMFQTSPKALANYRWGQILKPIGPLVSVAGVVIAYNGLKGYKDVATVQTRRTATNPSQEIDVAYTVRSLPKILGGIGLFVGGICLLELSNELTAKSAKLFIVRFSTQNSLPPCTVKLGMTASGNLGLEARF